MSAQIKLNITDVLIGLPQIEINTVHFNETFQTDLSSIDLQTKELERILLRYNNCCKLIFKKYSDLSGKRRLDDSRLNLNVNLNFKYMDTWSKVEKVVYNGRGLQV